MVQAIQGIVAQKIGIKNAQGFLSQTFIALAKIIGVKDVKGYSSQGVPLSIDFSSVASPQNLDLSAAQLKNQFGAIKTVFVDNSNNTASVSILNAVTRQNLIIPAGYQAYLPVASSVSQFQVSTSGGVAVGFVFLNVDVEPCMWNAEPSTTVIGSILFAGSAGIDHSANAVTYPPTGYSKIISIAANTSRAAIGVTNESADLVQIWRTSETGGQTMLPLNGAPASGYGGGAYYSQTYKGSLEVWVPTANAATDVVAAYED